MVKAESLNTKKLNPLSIISGIIVAKIETVTRLNFREYAINKSGTNAIIVAYDNR